MRRRLDAVLPSVADALMVEAVSYRSLAALTMVSIPLVALTAPLCMVVAGPEAAKVRTINMKPMARKNMTFNQRQREA